MSMLCSTRLFGVFRPASRDERIDETRLSLQIPGQLHAGAAESRSAARHR